MCIRNDMVIISNALTALFLIKHNDINGKLVAYTTNYIIFRAITQHLNTKKKRLSETSVILKSCLLGKNVCKAAMNVSKV